MIVYLKCVFLCTNTQLFSKSANIMFPLVTVSTHKWSQELYFGFATKMQ